jgi:transposase
MNTKLQVLFENIDLSFAQNVLNICFHTSGPGRPSRNPMGLFRTFIVMRMKGVRSLREMTRLLDTDPRLRKLCLIKKDEKGYTRSVLSRFIRKVGEDNLNKIIDEKVIKLLKSNAHEYLKNTPKCGSWMWLCIYSHNFLNV